MEPERRVGENKLLIFVGLGREKEYPVLVLVWARSSECLLSPPSYFFRTKRKKVLFIHFHVKMYFSRGSVVS